MALQDQLLRVREKLQLLLKQHHSALKDVRQLTRDNELLRKQLEEKNHFVMKLNEKMDALNISSMVTGADAKKELEKRINTYLKEIDKCLALLKT